MTPPPNEAKETLADPTVPSPPPKHNPKQPNHPTVYIIDKLPEVILEVIFTFASASVLQLFNYGRVDKRWLGCSREGHVHGLISLPHKAHEVVTSEEMMAETFKAIALTLKGLAVITITKGDHITNDSLETIGSSFPNLKKLTFWPETKVTCWSPLSNLAKLTHLDLHHANVTDEVLRVVNALRNLEVLRIGGPAVTPKGLEVLDSVGGKLQVLLIRETPGVSDLQIPYFLKAFPNLTLLELRDTKVTRQGEGRLLNGLKMPGVVVKVLCSASVSDRYEKVQNRGNPILR